MKPTTTADNFFGFSPEMKLPIIFSSGFHIVLFIMTAVGLPFVAKEPPISVPITVEIVKIDKKTQNPNPPKAQPEPQKPSPAPMQEEAPPDLTEPEPEKPKVDKKDMAPPETVPDPAKKPEPPKKEQKKDEKKPDPKATKVEKEEPKKDFSSVLKNLTPDIEDKPKPVLTQPDRTLDDVLEDTSNISELGDQLTMSEKDAVLYQLSQCWNVLSGAKYAEELVVQVRLKINRDRTVNDASVVDQLRYNRDPAFRAAADSALRALRNPRCSPLKLPPEKYDEWKSTIINFDPRDML